MRIVRIRLQHWRGVEDRTVELAPAGVTVVEGPNEAGKSSLVEALDILFDELDSSSKARVRSVRPVHADAGPEVEAEVESGPYRFVYSKRFHRRPQTQLTVTAPRPESHTGREAHERARAILEETLDVPLWRALRVAQGDGFAQADLSANRWLAAALERAAGGAAETGAREESLFDAIRKERDRWWSERGPRKEVTEADAGRDAAAAEVARLREALASLERDVDRAAQLAKEVTRVEASRADLERRASERAAAVSALTALRAARDDAEKRLAQAESVRTRALAARDERRKLVSDAGAASASSAEAGRALDAASPGREAAAAALVAAEQALAAAEAAAETARRDAELRERDFELRRDELDLAQLEERRARIETADRGAAAAEAVVERVKADDRKLRKLRSLHEDVVKAQVQFEAASAAVRIEALGPCEPLLDGAPTPLAAGESREVRVAGAWRLELPGALRVEVRPGSGTDEPRAELERARGALAEALGAAGVGSLEEAVAANASLNDAHRALADRDRVAKESLRDLTRDVLARKVENLRSRVAATRAERGAEPPLPADFDAAQELREATRAAASATAASLADARERREAARKRADAGDAEARDGQVRLRVLRERAAEVRALLDARRAETSDDALERAFTDADAAHGTIEAEAKSAREALAAAQPDVVEELARSARLAADRAREERHRLDRELEALRATLALRGEEGLAEALGAAEAKLDAAARAAARVHAQADAARALFDAMDGERAAERARYVRPFRERVVSLGRTVFGADFDVTVDDALRIVDRTAAGRTVPFESLSGGAKEQIGVLSRLACAILAADEGGVPVVLDDAFGWSDPDRLERMGALLDVAGRACQVVLLTCDPARHRHVPGARVVRLG